MFEKISQLENGNIFYSPLGLHILLSQVYMGSPKNSSTSQELAVLLDLNPEDDAKYLDSYREALATQEAQLSHLHNGSVVRIANKMYVAEDLEIKSVFENMTAKFFKSSILIMLGATIVQDHDNSCNSYIFWIKQIFQKYT